MVPGVLQTPMFQQPLADEAGLSSYWYVLLKRRWTIIGIAFVLGAIAAAVSFSMKPVYLATARLEIEPETPLFESANDIYQRVDADDPFIQTQIQILRGSTLAWQTIQQFNLAGSLGVLPPGAVTQEQAEAHKGELIAAFQDHVKIELLPKTRMLSVGYESHDPQVSAQIATGLANSYLDYNFRQKYESIRRSGWMEQQLEDLRKNVEASQQALVTYEQKNYIVETADKQNILTQSLSDLSHDLTAAKSERIQLEALYSQVLRKPSEMSQLAHDELLQKLESGLADLKGQYATVLAQYGPNFPKATHLQLQIKDQESQITQEQSRVVDRMRRDHSAAVEREKLVAAAVASQRDQVGNLNQLMVQDNILRHEFETNQQLYQSLLGRLKDATVSAGLRSTNIRLVDSALAPTLPLRPRKGMYTAAGLWAGLIVGVMCAFAREKLDGSVSTAEEAEGLILAPALAVLPLERDSNLGARQFLKKRSAPALGMALSDRPNSSFSEAFRALGTAVSVSADVPKTLLITSAGNGEGKTVTALNLAQALAQRKGPVLIVDCDLRRNGIAPALGLNNEKGVSTVLSLRHNASDAIQKCPGQPNLWALTSGPTPPYPAELLASDKMKELLEEVKRQFMCVIIDSPPVLAVTDATILSTFVDGVLMVVASGTMPRGGLLRTRRILANAGANVLGIAVNKIDPRFQGYGKYGYSYVKADWPNVSARVG